MTNAQTNNNKQKLTLNLLRKLMREYRLDNNLHKMVGQTIPSKKDKQQDAKRQRKQKDWQVE